jgi:hypothetical protein
MVSLDSEASLISTSSEPAAEWRFESLSKPSRRVLSSMLGKLASLRCGALRDTGRTCIIQSRSCHAVVFERAVFPTSVSSFNLSSVQRNTHSALARTRRRMISALASWSSMLFQSWGRPIICAAWRICSSKSEKSWLMACSRGRVDAESDFEVFQSVSCICRQYRNYRLLA